MIFVDERNPSVKQIKALLERVENVKEWILRPSFNDRNVTSAKHLNVLKDRATNTNKQQRERYSNSYFPKK